MAVINGRRNHAPLILLTIRSIISNVFTVYSSEEYEERKVIDDENRI